MLARVEGWGVEAGELTSMNSPRSSASVAEGALLDMVLGASTCGLAGANMPTGLYFALFFAIRFFFGFSFSAGRANAFMIGSLMQSRKVS